MDDALALLTKKKLNVMIYEVLILVVMDDALAHFKNHLMEKKFVFES